MAGSTRHLFLRGQGLAFSLLLKMLYCVFCVAESRFVKQSGFLQQTEVDESETVIEKCAMLEVWDLFRIFIVGGNLRDIKP